MLILNNFAMYINILPILLSLFSNKFGINTININGPNTNDASTSSACIDPDFLSKSAIFNADIPTNNQHSIIAGINKFNKNNTIIIIEVIR